ncbi:MAG: hypothetical protein WDN69_21445 [Aliidongia sp.]
MLPVNQPIGIDQCNCFTARKAARQISRMYDAYLQPTGLRITQFLILAALNQLRSAAVNGLAERLDIERTAMGENGRVFGARRLRPDLAITHGRPQPHHRTHRGRKRAL